VGVGGEYRYYKRFLRFTPDFYSVRSYFSSFTSADRVSARVGAARSIVDRLSIDSYVRSMRVRLPGPPLLPLQLQAELHPIGERGESLPLFQSAELPSEGLLRALPARGEGYIAPVLKYSLESSFCSCLR